MDANRYRMPPRCCTLLQMHTVVQSIGLQTAKEYREKFEEWISPNKIYCPAPACSTFIPERLIPQDPTAQNKSPSPLPEFLKVIINKVQESPPARFFRGEMDITQLPGYNNIVERPIDLSKINANIPRYDSVNSLTLDMQLLVSNATSYNGPGHPVSKAAEELYRLYTRALSITTQALLDTPPAVVKATSTFPCPKCHIAICKSCKHIEHGEEPCDTASADQELAMLESFGYKRCPRCKAGVKKMFGCSHMQCVCGAHWCWRCRRSIDECDGACLEGGEGDDDDDYDSEEDDLEGEPIVGDPGALPPPGPAPAPAANANPDAPVNLDAGGGRRWADGIFDFGEEPEDEGRMQVWSCSHKFSHYRITKEDSFDRGDYLSMECNRCFTKVIPRKPSISSRTLRHRIGDSSKSSSFGKWVRSLDKIGEEKGETAWECSRCRVVTCGACKKKYEDAIGPVD